jgi:5'-nucleotidase
MTRFAPRALLGAVACAALLAASLPAAAYESPLPPPPFMPGAPAGNNNLLPPPPVVIQSGYTVKPGDSFWKLAKRFYGKGAMWKVIADANPGKKSKDLKVGDTLVIP